MAYWVESCTFFNTQTASPFKIHTRRWAGIHDKAKSLGIPNAYTMYITFLSDEDEENLFTLITS